MRRGGGQRRGAGRAAGPGRAGGAGRAAGRALAVASPERSPPRPPGPQLRRSASLLSSCPPCPSPPRSTPSVCPGAGRDLPSTGRSFKGGGGLGGARNGAAGTRGAALHQVATRCPSRFHPWGGSPTRGLVWWQGRGHSPCDEETAPSAALLWEPALGQEVSTLQIRGSSVERWPP